MSSRTLEQVLTGGSAESAKLFIADININYRYQYLVDADILRQGSISCTVNNGSLWICCNKWFKHFWTAEVTRSYRACLTPMEVNKKRQFFLSDGVVYFLNNSIIQNIKIKLGKVKDVGVLRCVDSRSPRQSRYISSE